MASTTSSQIGVDLNNSGATQLFGLKTKILGDNASEWTYVAGTGALTTGLMVAITNGGTAFACTQGHFSSNAVMLGWAQSNWTAGDFGWVVNRGEGITVLCSGTAAPNATLFLTQTNPGALTTVVGGPCTLAGIQLIVSASTVSLVLTTATVTWPRCINAVFGLT